MKLQQAYISEAVAIGNWSVIGYKGPGDNVNATGDGAATSSTNNFTYTDASGWADNTIALATGATGFYASNKAKLNDFGIGELVATIQGSPRAFRCKRIFFRFF